MQLKQILQPFLDEQNKFIYQNENLHTSPKIYRCQSTLKMLHKKAGEGDALCKTALQTLYMNYLNPEYQIENLTLKETLSPFLDEQGKFTKITKDKLTSFRGNAR